MRSELDAFLSEYAKEVDKIVANSAFPTKAPPTAVAFGKKHGVSWKEPIAWGKDGQRLTEIKPVVVVTGSTLVLYHPCCKGFGKEIAAILRKAGAKVEREECFAPDLACRFTLPAGEPAKKLSRELEAFFAQRANAYQIVEFKHDPPWGKQTLGYEEANDIIWASDGKAFAFAMPFDLTGLEALGAYLARYKCKNVSFTLCDEKSRKEIAKLGSKAGWRGHDTEA